MAGGSYTTKSIPVSSKAFNGGLNSTSGPLNVQENESSDLQNVDFNKFGSLLKRNGYACLSTSSIGAVSIDCLHWYESNTTREAIAIGGGKFYQMTSLNGVWNTITTAGITLTPNYRFDSENFLNKGFFTNGQDVPIVYVSGGSAGAMTVPAAVTKAKFVKQFNNYLFIGNVAMGATDMPSRIYWSNIKDTDTWASDQFIEISKDDGQAITGMRSLGDRLVVYKERAIYNVFFTGDADIPFIMPGGGKSNSNVGCVASHSIQEIENGHVFLSYDGIYYYDGMSSYKISDRISSTLGVDNSVSTSVYADYTKFANADSCVQRSKNRYFLALTKQGSTNNNMVIVWDFFNNAFSLYNGISANTMYTFYVSGLDERPYFGDYSGYVYRMDYGTDDYPLNVKTAIDFYYYTNWKNFDDLCDQKGIPHIYLYYRNDTSMLTVSYNYDFQEGDAYSQVFSLSSGIVPYWGSVIWGTFNWTAGGGGLVTRRDLTGRGRVARFKLSNSSFGEKVRIDGLGTYVHAETMV